MFSQDYLIKYHHSLPPQHYLAEEILLGGILINSKIIEATLAQLSITAFALEAHRLIYRSTIDLYIQEKYIDPIALITTLWELNLLNQVGGIRKILDLLKQGQIFVSNMSDEATAHYYIKLIKDAYVKRLLIQYGYSIVKLAQISSIENTTIFFKAEKYIQCIKNTIIQDTNNTINSNLIKILFNIKNSHIQSHQNQLSSGFDSLDRLIRGFDKSDLVIIAGRPSMGKTSLSLNMALNLLKKKYQGIYIFSLEMSREQILYKLLSMESGIPLRKLKAGEINNQDWVALQQITHQLMQSIIYIDDSSNLSLKHLSSKVRSQNQSHKEISLIIIDYLQLLRLNNPLIKNRAEELSVITRELKILAKEFNIPIVILSQLNRNLESRINKKPLLSDLRESGCVGRKSKVLCRHKKQQKSLCYHKALPRKLQIQNHLIRENNWIIHGQHQYLYMLQNTSSTIIQMTHNHRIFTSTGWIKGDKAKKRMDLEWETNYFSRNKRRKIKSIKLYQKKPSYDLKAEETKMFCCNQSILTHNSIEQDADLVLMLYRESYYNHNAEDIHLTEIIVSKHRNGPTGTINLHFDPSLSSFTDISS
uniref:Replicative DNA helicase n=1 Tax=Scinaia undulata TaxID=1884664 RepID=A0A1G4NXU4_9FLOR|nr:Replication helicase subunit [Scinaia undulata]SCW23472.1 Replication helicase subunit [Scinaia undulata]